MNVAVSSWVLWMCSLSGCFEVLMLSSCALCTWDVSILIQFKSLIRYKRKHTETLGVLNSKVHKEHYLKPRWLVLNFCNTFPSMFTHQLQVLCDQKLGLDFRHFPAVLRIFVNTRDGYREPVPNFLEISVDVIRRAHFDSVYRFMCAYFKVILNHSAIWHSGATSHIVHGY